MLAQAVGDVVRGAVGDQGFDELVAAGRGEVGVGETQSLEVVHIVRELEVVVCVQNLAADRERLLGPMRVRGDRQHLVLGQQQCVGPEDFAGLCGVFRCGVVRVRPRGAFSGQRQHARPERGEHTLIGRHTVFVKLVEVVDQRVVGLAILLGLLGMAGADAEHESAGVGGIDAVERRGDGFGVRRPDVDDTGGNL
jgi:hypothetical protein